MTASIVRAARVWVCARALAGRVALLTVQTSVDNTRADRSDIRRMRLRLLSVLVVAVATSCSVFACKAYDPLYCDENKPCNDPARPFCDLNGDYPDSEGVARTCIPEPAMEPDAGDGEGTADGAPAADATSDRRIVQVSIGGEHTCAVLSDGGLRCWGAGEALGYRTIDDIGDNEHPYQAGDVPTGGRVKQVAAGGGFTCALYEGGNVRCWGSNQYGTLGYGHTDDLFGAGKTPDVLPDLELGGPVSMITAGGLHVCALLVSGEVRCWGNNGAYQLATGDEEAIGDNEVPGSRSPLQLGSEATSLSAALFATCAVVKGDFVRCWGLLGGFSGAPMGYGGVEIIGDDETPAQAGNINVGGSTSAVATGSDHICALLSAGRVRCWGLGGSLGYQEDEPIGDDETPASAGDVDVGGPIVELAAAGTARCARLSSGSLRCWGSNGLAGGVLGSGSPETIGDDETPAEAGDVQVGGAVVQLAVGASAHTCAILDDGAIRCWGKNDRGALGLGHTATIGDDETPADVDPVRVLE
jgi:alpha-tubulin suppressor-like RCC1 family protein